MCHAGPIKSIRTGDYYKVAMKERARIISLRRMKRSARGKGVVGWGPLTNQFLYGMSRI